MVIGLYREDRYNVCVCVSVCLACVLPPVVSCIKLRDIEAQTEKHWKKPPNVLLRPNATNSCKKNTHTHTEKGYMTTNVII